MSVYVLDTSALLTYIENEDGVAEVNRVLLEALDNRHTLYMSVISGIEVFYITYQEQGAILAQERLQLLQDLPIIQEPVRRDDVTGIGMLKANHAMSFADCCIAGLAKQKSAIHKDPEFEQIVTVHGPRSL
jgi:uncharacterized protein